MKHYSIPRQIWRAVNMPLTYLAVQIVIDFGASFVSVLYTVLKWQKTE